MGLFGYKCCKCREKVGEFDTLDVYLYNFAKGLSDDYPVSLKEAGDELERNAAFESMEDYYCGDCAAEALGLRELIHKYEKKVQEIDEFLTSFEADDEPNLTEPDLTRSDEPDLTKKEPEFNFDDEPKMKTSSNDADDFESKLEKLKNLYNKGLISESDYNKKKDAILADL